jgi:hypothetical protein
LVELGNFSAGLTKIGNRSSAGDGIWYLWDIHYESLQSERISSMLRCQIGILISIRSLDSITNLARAADISGWAVATFNCKLLSLEKASTASSPTVFNSERTTSVSSISPNLSNSFHSVFVARLMINKHCVLISAILAEVSGDSCATSC